VGLDVGTVAHWLWDVPPGAPAFIPLRDPAAYRLPDPALLHRAPHEVLVSPRAAGPGARLDDRQVEYCRASADVTMRGGTASGVVYPLAVCEIARTYRLRSVGGASAGAIAAAVAAAAEVGRTALDEGTAPGGDLTQERAADGHVRPGFAGLADTMAWLAEVDEPAGSRQFRVGQLFRPGVRALPLFRLVVAVMRGRAWAVPLLAVGAVGRVSMFLTPGILLLGVLLLGARRSSGGPSTGVSVAAGAGVAVLGLAGLATVLAGAVWGVLVAADRWPRPARPPELAEPVPRPPEPARAWWPPGLLVPAGLAATVGAVRLGLPWWGLAVAVVLVLVAVTLVLGGSVAWLVARAGRGGYGLVPGSAPPRRRGCWGRLAGLPAPTVTRPLVPWLSETLSELAGLPTTEVLRFGHLWWGIGYQPGALPADAVHVACDPLRRRVNLEVMASELVHRRAYRLPLRPVPERAAEDASERDEELLFRRSDLTRPGREVFPREVVDALLGATERLDARDVRTGEHLDDLRPLPRPWDMPVVVATRLSLSLPGLFEAVRLYRRVRPETVRDDLGRPLLRNGTTVVYPAPGPDGRQPMWVEELWFTDGGVTSNFPIHFFDSVTPLWPTFGIDLGGHPPGAAHQDVSLPSDWQGAPASGNPLSGSMTRFLAAVLDTAIEWRDTTQAVMPSHRGRVARVRHRPGEGGVNLFLTREEVAALALRGVLAGARLAKRFEARQWWYRHQWLRLRASLGNLEQLRATIRTSVAAPAYDDLLRPDGAAALDRLRHLPFPADPQQPGDAAVWYLPEDSGVFFAAAADMREAIVGLPATPELADGVPQPAPQLRQVPPP
jgi:hypothetical protein